MRSACVLAASTLLLSTLAGCHVSSHKDGKNDNVDIGTPFGSMQVKTNDNVSATGIGITPYPGAQIEKNDKGKNDSAADVNMSFGSFHFGVKAVAYSTPDSSDKVLAFYKKDLARYGTVLQCDGKTPVGQPTHTAEGLTCDYDSKKSGHISFNDDPGKMELRTGSKQHQHIVSIEKKDGGSRMGLVALDLPSNLSVSGDNGKDSD